MSSESSTLSSHSVVLCWLKDHADSPFPMQEFTKAISYDLQGSHVLLQHIAHIRPFWKHGLPSTHRRRHQLYVGDLQPRLAKDLKRVERLIAFVKAEVQVFCARSSRMSVHDTSFTLSLLKQLEVALQHLLSQIDSLPSEETALPQQASDKVAQDRKNTSQDRRNVRREESRKEKPKKQVRFAGVQQAQKLLSPSSGPFGAPAIGHFANVLRRLQAPSRVWILPCPSGDLDSMQTLARWTICKLSISTDESSCYAAPPSTCSRIIVGGGTLAMTV
ncbi:hypothetical protein PRZ48_006223 [Zasmidium cellare]|uniref:Uncharacterized protein n=1 Tax=Zasmidium cellare TaxID=395010 RepID=A0ABR0EMS9_ZASCE|nr:hypothetical protein PRZ48_006223 [Zasmidium cellare]